MEIKKLIPYVIAGVSGAMLTVGALSFAMSRSSSLGDFNLFQKDQPKAYFASASYAPVSVNPPDLTVAAQKTVNAVVSVKNYSSRVQQQQQMFNPFDFFFGDPFGDSQPQPRQRQQQQQPKDVPTGLGSGVIISTDGYIVTNNHVISGADKIEVTLNNQKTYTATVVGADPNTDIALLKIDEKNLPFLSFYSSDDVKVGEWVLAVGNPFGLTSTVTAGIISAKGRSLGLIKSGTNAPIESFIQTDAAINMGNSGGALVNSNGDLIGINTAISSHSGAGTYEGYGFAVPSNIAKKVVEDIRQYGIVQRGMLGIATVDLSDEDGVRLYNAKNKTSYKTQESILVDAVQDDSGAKDAGIKKGDIITAIDGMPIKNFATLSGIIGEKRPGDQVNVTILRDGASKNFTVKLKDSKGNTKLKTKEDMSVSEKLGASFKELTDRQKVNYGLDSGVVVTDMDDNGKLASIGIQEGYIIMQINDKPVNSESDIEKILKNYKGTVSVNYIDDYGSVYRRGFTMD